MTVEIEPYRESAQRVLIEIHIAEGNYATALRQYQRYRGMLQRELGIGPTPQLDRLVQPLTAG
jgi:DNA-binding SARP family transcriptional activator